MRNLVTLAAVAALALPLTAQNTKCTFKPFGASCGPRLTATDVIRNGTHVMTFRVSKAPDTSLGVLALGLKTANFQFPGTKCFLHLEPILFFPMNSNANGQALRIFGLHSSVKIEFLAQAGFVQMKHHVPIETSNGLRVTCK